MNDNSPYAELMKALDSLSTNENAVWPEDLDEAYKECKRVERVFGVEAVVIGDDTGKQSEGCP